ncbi:cation:proton antiporter subunit C [Legionella oakridgensis]|uniref:Multisubunit Na+/H+ antiporter MrpC n=2 Tax=Legionella oakridgensis TaxID=29423 RepID=W0BF32_9GAMM|nr:cation:proton antiporter subunit C [Legionella oakridgensis]AHE67237.1 multisubunit Na+/H+ antiporter MrpC [Legionella oakridgensis ATCC 33761 = DSM 21215]ETO93199.1 multisubunit Na+/H+ antiporter, MnhC subunit [Legionella oakridgensis RV-2-2007]KTD37966.1 Na(+)/H(+) antiporter subunit C1 [Legionella oakridgensis]STY20313.1 Mrp complex subunit C1 [Legionella longbeachae]
MTHLPYFVIVWLFVVSLYGILSSRNLIHMINCLTILQSSAYIFLLIIGYHQAGTAPVFSDHVQASAMVDPIVQAITLTDIIVASVVTSLLLAIAIQAYKQFGTLDPYQLIAMKG